MTGCDAPLSEVALRPECDSDSEAMRAIFFASRRAPLDAAGFDGATVDRLMEHQFQMQRAGYRAALPSATWEAIVVGGDEVVGRIVTDRGEDWLLLVDIVVDPARQRQGIGSAVLGQLIARAGDRRFELRVDRGSPAVEWYRRFGFEQTGDDELQLHLVRHPSVTDLAPTGVSR